MKKQLIQIFTDGSVKNNQSKFNTGGFGVYIEYESGFKRDLSGTEINTTNSRMEMKAILESLKYLNEYCSPENTIIKLYSDSAFIVNTFNEKWYRNWISKNWIGSKKKPIANSDLWKEIIPLALLFNVTFIKVKGHSGHYGNEIADALAKGEPVNIINP